MIPVVAPLYEAEAIDLISSLGLCSDEIETIANFITQSSYCWTIRIHGDLVGIMGLIPQGTLVTTTAYYWFYHTPLLKKHRILFSRNCREVVQCLFLAYDCLVGHCVTSNPQAIRWLRWLGATIHPINNIVVEFELRAS